MVVRVIIVLEDDRCKTLTIGKYESIEEFLERIKSEIENNIKR